MIEHDFNELVHAERSKLLAQLPKGARTLLSAGCAGGWYFDWVEECYGPVETHVGVELYSPRPDDLPANVQWIQNSVSNMVDVQSGSVDLLFSGQNIEHLFYNDLVGFLRESNRVVRDGGYICLDSPNRGVTQDLGYTQPQHVLELSIPDAIDLAEAAGFNVISVDGIWDCADGLRRYANADGLLGDIQKRRSEGRQKPETAFIWWIVAQKAGPAADTLEATVDRIVERSFRPFVAARFRTEIGRVHSMEGTETIIRVPQDRDGYALFGPYIPLQAGDYKADFDVKVLDGAGTMHFDISAAGGSELLAACSAEIPKGGWTKISLPFSVGAFTEGVETRVLSQSTDALVRFGTQILRV